MIACKDLNGTNVEIEYVPPCDTCGIEEDCLTIEHLCLTKDNISRIYQILTLFLLKDKLESMSPIPFKDVFETLPEKLRPHSEIQKELEVSFDNQIKEKSTLNELSRRANSTN